MSDDFELCIARISQCELSDHQLAIVNNLSLLISVREGDHLLLGFTSYEIAELINELAIRGAKVGGLGGVATPPPPEFWKGGLNPLIFRKICVEIIKIRLFCVKFLKVGLF